ncbi:MAG: type I-C CRISPR-associated protein Cas5 [Peptostreptococcaceae bacterium]|nr:type I-C CRISPR-associated protein Cas5 [Peptostreptococcaceae bacterium]
MEYGIRIRVWGDWACFTRPEMKVERVSYDVMTPSAARGILEAIHWKPAISWVIDAIYVEKPVRFENIRRNEVESKVSASKVKSVMNGNEAKNFFIDINKERQQRASMILRDVSYIIEAHFEMTDKAGEDDNEGKHRDIFRRRAIGGKCFHRPYLGCREFPAMFEWVEEKSEIKTINESGDLGWMLFDIDFKNDMTPGFCRLVMKEGRIEIPSRKEVFS